MKEIVVISGKGGTGKTSITASFAVLAGDDVVVADCDVDAADMHILLQPENIKSEDFYSGELAVIDEDACIQCGKCFDVCRFDAVEVINDVHTINELSCEGCGYCARVCPTEAITNEPLNVGKWHVANTRFNQPFVHAKLGIGADNSGKLVAQVKNIAKETANKNNKPYVLVDGSPGVGCPVVSSLSGAHFVVLVTEPSVSGLHDLKRVYELVKKFRIKAGCIINKADINKDIASEILEFLKEEDIVHLSNLPYDETFTKAMTDCKTIVEIDDSKIKEAISESWEKIKEILN
ncbi:MAG: ATP-binding protein [Ichthyobacteriaceae bacterium]|nr:ATP-binding protein [Ichthyobacteriaceae bacterium]